MTVYLLFWSSTDLSASQTGNQRVFGATYMTMNDPSVFGGLAAIQGAGLSDRFLVYSVDGSPEGKALVSDHLLTATCAQFPYKMAEEAVAQAYQAIAGGCEQREVIVPVELLTADNVDQYGTDGWQ